MLCQNSGWWLVSKVSRRCLCCKRQYGNWVEAKAIQVYPQPWCVMMSWKSIYTYHVCCQQRSGKLQYILSGLLAGQGSFHVSVRETAKCPVPTHLASILVCCKHLHFGWFILFYLMPLWIKRTDYEYQMHSQHNAAASPRDWKYVGFIYLSCLYVNK